jgi:chemotaxis protein CheX
VKAELINPFIRSTNELFTTMLGTQVRRDSVGVSQNGVTNHGVIALIGFSGAVLGTMALVFPIQTAIAMTTALLGETKTSFDGDVADSMAEIANMIGGGAKSDFTKPDGTLAVLGLPTVMSGSDSHVDYPSGALWVNVRFESSLGPFSLHLTFPELQQSKGEPT